MMLAIRRAFRLVRYARTLLSLVLCVATVGLWVRTYHAPREIGIRSNGPKGTEWCTLITAPVGSGAARPLAAARQFDPVERMLRGSPRSFQHALRLREACWRWLQAP